MLHLIWTQLGLPHRRQFIDHRCLSDVLVGLCVCVCVYVCVCVCVCVLRSVECFREPTLPLLLPFLPCSKRAMLWLLEFFTCCCLKLSWQIPGLAVTSTLLVTLSLEPDFTPYVESSGPEWYISSMLYSRDIPFWSKTFDMFVCKHETDLLELSSRCVITFLECHLCG